VRRNAEFSTFSELSSDDTEALLRGVLKRGVDTGCNSETVTRPSLQPKLCACPGLQQLHFY
jgi:hypothetical protein